MNYKQSRLPLILAGLIGGAVLLASSGVYASTTAFDGLQYSLVSYQENGFDGTRQTSWADQYGQLENEDLSTDERSVDDWLDHSSSAPGTGIGMGVAPLFDTYGVFRTSGSRDKSTYLALGYISDELTMDETGTTDSRDDNKFSYGFGVNNTTSNFEYMMSVDQENYGVSAVGMRFISEF